MNYGCPIQYARTPVFNNRPRKVLGYLTPLEFLANDHSVALHN